MVIRILGAIGIPVSLVFTLVLIKKKGLVFFMRNLFFEEDGFLEKPFRRFCLILLIGLALFFQNVIKSLSDYSDTESMVIVIGTMNIALGILYIYIQKNFV